MGLWLSHNWSSLTQFILTIIGWFVFGLWVYKKQQKLKCSLQKDINKNSTLCVKRIEAVHDIYEQLENYVDELGGHIDFIKPTPEDEIETISRALGKLHIAYCRTFASNKVYLPKNIADAIEKINHEIYKATNRYFRRLREGNFDIKLKNDIQENIKPAIDALEIELRKLIGAE